VCGVASRCTRALAASAAQAADRSAIRIGWTAWSDAEAVTQIARQVLEERLDYRVELVMTDIGLQYAGVARGNLDVMLMAWLPTTHKAYWDRCRATWWIWPFCTTTPGSAGLFRITCLRAR